MNYAVAGQGAPGLAIGEWKQTQAPRMDSDLVDLIEKRKIPVFVIEEDLAARGIERAELVPEVELLSSKTLPQRMAEYELVCIGDRSAMKYGTSSGCSRCSV